jgi:hypothetical protein
VLTEVEGFTEIVGMSNKGKILQGDQVPKGKQMMEETLVL